MCDRFGLAASNEVEHVPLLETSRRMSAVRQSGTSAELQVRRALSRIGLRYRLNVRSLPGSPDLANVRQRFAVFVHGCFWHRHRDCPYATMPKTNKAFWTEKFDANVRRDDRAKKSLRERGFRVIVVWECEARAQRLVELLSKALKGVDRCS